MLHYDVVVALLPQVIQLRDVALIAALQCSHGPCLFEKNLVAIVRVHIFKLNRDSNARDQVETFEDFSERPASNPADQLITIANNDCIFLLQVEGFLGEGTSSLLASLGHYNFFYLL